MKTKYLVPQTESLDLWGERLMDGFIASPDDSMMPAPGRFAPGGGDLGGIPAA